MMADSFLSRWSKRKTGQLDEPEEQPKAVAQTPDPIPTKVEAPPPATLEDVQKIDRFDPDFSAFMKPDVDPTVQQAALKKMFTDPHFNVMDGLDIYIDDYSKPDPLPPGMLERMAQSEMLQLFRKTGDDLTPKEGQSTEPTALSQANQNLLQAESQTDLTSTDSSVQINTANEEELPVEPTQKKT
jgi:DNA uptake protein ComE-like DNA-binding protein